MKRLILMTLGAALIGAIPAATASFAQEIQTYRPAPRGLDVTPRTQIIQRNSAGYKYREPDCRVAGSGCYNFRRHKPVGPSGPSQAERCKAAYQSYRGFDNTYQPYVGPRRRCDL